MEFDTAIIVLNYKKYLDTIRCVECLVQYSTGAYIYIVDNKSGNESVEVLKKHFAMTGNVSIVTNTNNSGYASGNNFGVRIALAEHPNIKYVIIANPDTLIMNESTIQNLKDRINDHKDIAIIAPLNMLEKEFCYEYIWWEIPNKRKLLESSFAFYKMQNTKRKLKVLEDGVAPVDVVPGSFFLVKSDVFKEIGMFDENTFLYNEENILAIKLKRAGYKEALLITEFYYHIHEKSNSTPTLKERLNLINMNFKSKKYLCEEYYSKNLVLPLCIILGINYAYACYRTVRHQIANIIKHP